MGTATRPPRGATRRTAKRGVFLAAAALSLLPLLLLQDTHVARRREDYIERRRAAIAGFDWEGYLQGSRWRADRGEREEALTRKLGEVTSRLARFRNGLRAGPLPVIWNVKRAVLARDRLQVVPEVGVRLGHGYLLNTRLDFNIPFEGRTTVEGMGIEMLKTFGTVNVRTDCELLFKEGAVCDYAVQAEVKIF